MIRKIPFPQANNLKLMFEILCSIENSGVTKERISANFVIHNRLASYYLNALAYVGLVEKINSKYFLTLYGNEVIGVKDSMKKYLFIEMIANSENFSVYYKKYHNYYMDKKALEIEIQQMIIEKIGMNNSTAKRRAECIMSWFEQMYDFRQKEEKH